jgi:hypothetical protein
MSSNRDLDTEVIEVPAKVYPGTFERELQATVNIQGQEVTVIVSSGDVVIEETPPPESGILGKLNVLLVGADEQSVVVDLPGEPLGTYRRFRIPRAQLRDAFAAPA